MSAYPGRPMQIASDHPLAELANALEQAHERSEQGKECDEEDCAIQRIFQEHSACARVIIKDVCLRIAAWVGSDTTLVPYRGDALHALETCDVGSAQEMVIALKTAALRVCMHFTGMWTQENSDTPIYAASQGILAKLPLPCAPETNIRVGFRTPVGFIGNLALLSMQVFAREHGPESLSIERMEQMMRNNWNIAVLLASCRKEVFMELQDVLFQRPVPSDRHLATYDPSLFALAGEESKGSLQLTVRPDVVNGIRGDMHGLTRERCPSLGHPLQSFYAWQQGLYNLYFSRHIDKLKDMDEQH